MAGKKTKKKLVPHRLQKKQNRWQKALDESNVRQGEMSPRYKSRLDEQKRIEDGTLKRARANQAKRKAVTRKKAAKGTATKKKKKRANS